MDKKEKESLKRVLKIANITADNLMRLNNKKYANPYDIILQQMLNDIEILIKVLYRE